MGYFFANSIKEYCMKSILIAIVAVSLVNMPTALAKGRGGGKSFRSSSYKYTKPPVNTTTSSSHSQTSTTANHRGRTPIYSGASSTSNEKRVIKYAITNKKAGLTTCANQHCSIVQYLPKGTKVELIESKNGFYLLKNGIQWISAKDII